MLATRSWVPWLCSPGRRALRLSKKGLSGSLCCDVWVPDRGQVILNYTSHRPFGAAAVVNDITRQRRFMAPARRQSLWEQLCQVQVCRWACRGRDLLRVRHEHPPSGRAGLESRCPWTLPTPLRPYLRKTVKTKQITSPTPTPTPGLAGRLAFKSLDLAQLLLKDNKGDSSVLFKS